jgi:hypothetical protein
VVALSENQLLLGASVPPRLWAAIRHRNGPQWWWDRTRGKKVNSLRQFAKKGQFQQLMVEDCDVSATADTAWLQHQQDDDREALAKKKALFFRATFLPSLASAVGNVRNGDGEALCRFADRLLDGLTRRLASHPAPLDSMAQTIVLTKRS